MYVFESISKNNQHYLINLKVFEEKNSHGKIIPLRLTAKKSAGKNSDLINAVILISYL